MVIVPDEMWPISEAARTLIADPPDRNDPLLQLNDGRRITLGVSALELVWPVWASYCEKCGDADGLPEALLSRDLKWLRRTNSVVEACSACYTVVAGRNRVSRSRDLHAMAAAQIPHAAAAYVACVLGDESVVGPPFPRMPTSTSLWKVLFACRNAVAWYATSTVGENEDAASSMARRFLIAWECRLQERLAFANSLSGAIQVDYSPEPSFFEAQ